MRGELVVGTGVGAGVVLTGLLGILVVVAGTVVVATVVVVTVGATVVVVVGATVVVVVVAVLVVTIPRLGGSVIVVIWEVSVVEPVRVRRTFWYWVMTVVICTITVVNSWMFWLMLMIWVAVQAVTDC